MIDKKHSSHPVSQRRGVFDHFHGLYSIHVFVFRHDCGVFSGFCFSFCLARGHRVASPGLGVLWSCLPLTGEYRA